MSTRALEKVSGGNFDTTVSIVMDDSFRTQVTASLQIHCLLVSCEGDGRLSAKAIPPAAPMVALFAYGEST